jgi:hypothetical protein
VRIECFDGKVEHYEGESGVERLVTIALPDGIVVHYSGEKGHERLESKVWPDGHKQVYDAYGSLAKTECVDGTEQFFVGAKDAERFCMAKRAWPTKGSDGQCLDFYEGEKGAECLTRKECKYGASPLEVWYYRGEQGNERLYLKACADGSKKYYDGEKDHERRVCKECANGDVWHYKGAKGDETLVGIAYVDGGYASYEGTQGDEHTLTRIK